MTTRAYFTKKSRSNIYEQGKAVKKTHADGKNAGKEYVGIDRTQPANKQDKVLIKKGESYWWWKFAFGSKIFSSVKPRRSQLTRSEFLSWLYDFEDVTICNATASSQSDLESLKDEWVGEIESMRDDLEGRLSNMPEQLQDSSPIQERIDGLESWISDLEGVDLDIDEDELKTEAEKEFEGQEAEDESIKDAAIMDKFNELLQEKVEEILSELQSQSSGL